MGTHPIFESDFDCLTDVPVGLKSKKCRRISSGQSSTNSPPLISNAPELRGRKSPDISRARIAQIQHSRQSQWPDGERQQRGWRRLHGWKERWCLSETRESPSSPSVTPPTRANSARTKSVPPSKKLPPSSAPNKRHPNKRRRQQKTLCSHF